MFICIKRCADRVLKPQARDWLWPQSMGACEICHALGLCLDVPSALDWPWASPKPFDGAQESSGQINHKQTNK